MPPLICLLQSCIICFFRISNRFFNADLKFVEALKPEVFVIENVRRILTTANGWFKDEILRYIEALGYKVTYGILNAFHYGVPQSRERAFFLCSKTIRIPLPSEEHKIVSVRDAISDLAYLESGEGDFESDYITVAASEYQRMMRKTNTHLYNHQASNHSDYALYKLSLIPPEKGQEYLPDELRGKQIYHTTWCRLVWDTYSPTIDTRFDTPSNGTNSHPELNRSITPREAARIQSFDDAFIFYGNKSSVCKQIGNAVPPLLAKSIADTIYNAYETSLEENSKVSLKKSADGQFYFNNGLFGSPQYDNGECGIRILTLLQKH